MSGVSDDMAPVYRRIFEGGREARAAECACNRTPVDADLPTYEDGVEEGYGEGVEDGQRRGALCALLAVFALLAVAVRLRGRG